MNNTQTKTVNVRRRVQVVNGLGDIIVTLEATTLAGDTVKTKEVYKRRVITLVGSVREATFPFIQELEQSGYKINEIKG